MTITSVFMTLLRCEINAIIAITNELLLFMMISIIVTYAIVTVVVLVINDFFPGFLALIYFRGARRR